jgi:dTDP-glucose 4,6-dehydratase
LRYLITGGAGFIGSHFVHALLEKESDAQIINLDLLTYAGNLENIADLKDSTRHQFVHGDICDRKLVDRLMSQSDAVVHFAAESFVDRSIYNAEAFIRTDIYGTFVLLEAARKYGIKKFIHISTDEVYGSCSVGSFREEDPLMPTNPYAASKAGADRLAFSFYKTYQLPVIITRSCNNYGSYQYPEKLIPLFITNALQDSRLPIYGDGMQVRDWIYVQDHCSALLLLLRRGVDGEVYNISAGELYTNLEITQKILMCLQKPTSLVEHVTDRPGHDRRYSLDSNRLKGLGWNPAWNLDQGLQFTVQWYKENADWWRSIREHQLEYKEFHNKHYNNIREGSWQIRPE